MCLDRFKKYSILHLSTCLTWTKTEAPLLYINICPHFLRIWPWIFRKNLRTDDRHRHKWFNSKNYQAPPSQVQRSKSFTHVNTYLFLYSILTNRLYDGGVVEVLVLTKFKTSLHKSQSEFKLDSDKSCCIIWSQFIILRNNKI